MMKINLSRVFMFITLVGCVLLLSLEPRKTVYLALNETTIPIETSALTLNQFLQEENIPIREGDQVSTENDSWLKDGQTITVEQATQVLIIEDESEHSILTVQRKPLKMLQEAQIQLGPQDVLLVNGQELPPDEPLPYSESHSLQVLRASQVSLDVDGESFSFNSTAATLGQALWEQGITLTQADVLQPPPTTPLDGDMQADLVTAQEFQLYVDGSQVELLTTSDNIAEALAHNGIPLQGLDYTVPPADEPIPHNGLVHLVRVEEIITLETETIPFSLEYQPVADLDLDQRAIVEPGLYGLVVKRIRTRVEDGEPVMQQVEDEFITRLPQPRVIGYGTRIVPRTLDTPQGPMQYWRALDMYAVSYNPTSAGGNITASGLPLRKGLVAVDPRYIPLGTRLYIPGYGEALAADTGGGVRGRIIDLGYSDDDYEHWSSNVTVYFLWPPPDQVVWIIP
jgi:resuscitation-promoting factor RpfB